MKPGKRKRCRYCSKTIYVSEKEAETDQRLFEPNNPTFRPYRCPAHRRYWHLGHGRKDQAA